MQHAQTCFLQIYVSSVSWRIIYVSNHCVDFELLLTTGTFNKYSAAVIFGTTKSLLCKARRTTDIFIGCTE